MSCADPVGALLAEAEDLNHVLAVARFLHELRYEYVAVVHGGLCEMLREARARGSELPLAGGGGGWLQLASDAYSRLDFEDSHSFARFLTAYVHQFEAKPARTDSLASGGGGGRSSRGSSLEEMSFPARGRRRSDMDVAAEKTKAVLSRVGSASSSAWAKWGSKKKDRGESLELEEEEES
jgi:hypothetical protein